MNEYPWPQLDPHERPTDPVGGETAVPAEPVEDHGTWKRLMFVVKAIEIRLRFVAILVAVGLIFGYWETIRNHWDKWSRPKASAEKLDQDTVYSCPMHPNVVRTSLDPDGTIPKCPICGMPLEKRKRVEPVVLGPDVVSQAHLAPEQIQLGGVRTEVVGYRPLVTELRAVGFVDFDESRLSRIVTRVGGYVEKLYVNKSFSNVKQGEPLAEIYSPELYTAVQELLLARRNNSQEFVSLGREKLQLMGIDKQDIDDALRSGDSNKRLVLRSPRNGHLIRKEVVEGDRIEAGKMLFEIADLSVVWIEGEIYEKDIGLVRPGQDVEATVESYPNRIFRGKVNLVHPHLETSTRTIRVRFEVDNPGHVLRPGMYATVRLQTPIKDLEPYRSQLTPLPSREGPGEGQAVDAARDRPPAAQKRIATAEGVLSVPERTVIDTGTQKIVYVEREPNPAGEHIFDGVLVKLGPRAGNYYAVVDGLAAGDRVAATGAFLIDAETRVHPIPIAEKSDAKDGSGKPSAGPTQPTKTPSASDLANVAKLPDADRELALKQKFCPITDNPLGSMGVPIRIRLADRIVFLCCTGCEDKARRDPQKVLQKLEAKPVPAPAVAPDQGGTKP